MITNISIFKIICESNVPKLDQDIPKYLIDIIKNFNSFDARIKALNQVRSAWSDKDFENAMEEACYGWNTTIGKILKDLKYDAKIYFGEPKEDWLPEHYITICNGYIFDFVVGQFWGYGLGNLIDNEAKVTFTPNEYSDIYNSYIWKEI